MSENEELNLYESDVRNMSREQLIDFFYDYIKKSQYIINRSKLIEDRISQNNINLNKELKKLDDKYYSFYHQNLKYNQSKTKRRIEKFKEKVKKIRLKWRIVFSKISNHERIKYRYIFIFIWLLRYIPVMNNPFKIYGFGYTLFVSLVVYFFAKPFNFLFYRMLDVFFKQAIKHAERKDISSAKKKGITEENAKEVFGYEDINNKINDEFCYLKIKINLWQETENKETNHELAKLQQKIPTANRKLENIIYMYEQLYVGATDTWKEAINDLKVQLRHEEMTNELRRITNEIISTNNQLVQMNSNLNHNFAKLGNMISFETERIHSRIESLYDNVEGLYDYYYPYYY